MKKGLIIGLAAVLVLGLSAIGMAVTVETPVFTPHVTDYTRVTGDIVWGATAYKVTNDRTKVDKDAFAFTWNGTASVFTSSTDVGGSHDNFQSGLSSTAIGTYAHAEFEQMYKTSTGPAGVPPEGDWWRSPYDETYTSGWVKYGDVQSVVWTDTGILTFPEMQPTSGVDEYKYASAAAGSSSGWAYSEAHYERTMIDQDLGGAYPNYVIYGYYEAHAGTGLP